MQRKRDREHRFFADQLAEQITQLRRDTASSTSTHRPVNAAFLAGQLRVMSDMLLRLNGQHPDGWQLVAIGQPPRPTR